MLFIYVCTSDPTTSSLESKIEKVLRDIQGEKSSKDMTSSRNLVSTIRAQASPQEGTEPGVRALPAEIPHPLQMLHGNLIPNSVVKFGIKVFIHITRASWLRRWTRILGCRAWVWIPLWSSFFFSNCYLCLFWPSGSLTGHIKNEIKLDINPR